MRLHAAGCDNERGVVAGWGTDLCAGALPRGRRD